MRYITLSNNKVISVRIGESIVDGEIESSIGECGQLRQNDGTFTDFPMDFDSLKNQKIQEITNACQNEINSQFESSVSGVIHIYGYNKDDQQNFVKQAMLFQINPSLMQITWSTKNGLVQLTKEQFFDLINDASTHENSIWARYFPLKAQIDIATSVEQLEVIAWA